jgi:NB-ARC domain
MKIGPKSDDFAITFSLSGAFEVEHFVARTVELEDIQKALNGDDNRRTVILHGLGGIGKTQLAVAYAKRHKHSYSAIFWLNAKDEDSLKQSFVKEARRILRNHALASRLSGLDMKGKMDEIVDAVKEWLDMRGNTRWLLIYDNYDSPRMPGNPDPKALDIRKYLPESYQGSIIITTRSSQVKVGHLMPITKLLRLRDSLEILSSTSRREELVNGEHTGLVPTNLTYARPRC